MSILEWIVYYCDLLPIVAYLVFFLSKKKIAKRLWVILFYCVYSFANNSKVVYDYFHHQNSNLFLYIFTIVEYALFAIFIYNVLEKELPKRTLLWCSVLFICFCLFNILFQPLYRFDSVQTAIESLLLLIFCIIFLFEQINKPQLVFIYSSYQFWVITGILIYLAATFFLYVFASSLPKKVANEYWVINSFSCILRNIFFAIAILVFIKSSKTPYNQNPWNLTINHS